MISELVRATVAEPKLGAVRHSGERRGRQICEHRNTNVQRGRLRAARVLANSKPNPHNDAASRGRWNAEKVQALTRGGLPVRAWKESAEVVVVAKGSGGRRPALTNDTANPDETKDRSNGNMAYLEALGSRRKDPSTREAARKAKIPDDHSPPRESPSRRRCGGGRVENPRAKEEDSHE